MSEETFLSRTPLDVCGEAVSGLDALGQRQKGLHPGFVQSTSIKALFVHIND
jgi:hypothetical protein